MFQLLVCVLQQGSFSDYQPQYNKPPNPLLLLHKSGSFQQETSAVSAEPSQEEICRRAAQSVFGNNPLPRLESHTLEVSFNGTQSLFSTTMWYFPA